MNSDDPHRLSAVCSGVFDLWFAKAGLWRFVPERAPGSKGVPRLSLFSGASPGQVTEISWKSLPPRLVRFDEKLCCARAMTTARESGSSAMWQG
jgi:hypothetical protein